VSYRLTGISEGAQFVKRVPQAPLAFLMLHRTGSSSDYGRAETALVMTRDRGGRSRPAAGRPEGKP
jgi:hypothetical protein